MSSRFTVDLELLDDLVVRMTAFERRLTAMRDDVEARMRHVQGEWTGRAASEQFAAHRLWASGAGQMQDATAVLRTIARTAHENYTAAMRANAAMWSG